MANNIFPPVKRVAESGFLNCDPTISSDQAYAESNVKLLNIVEKTKVKEIN